MNNKRSAGKLVVFVFMLMMFAFSAYGADDIFTYKDYTYTVRDNDTVQIVKYDGNKKSVTVPSKIDGMAVSVIGSHAFSGCKELQSLVIPGSVRDLHECAVSYCPKLKSLTIKEGSLKTLDMMDIYSCWSLSTVSLPKSLSGFSSFYDCDSVEKVSVNSKSPYYKSHNGVVYTKDLKTLVYYPPGKKDTYFIVPASVDVITRTAFNNAKHLGAVYVPKTVKEIGETAFGYTSVVIYYEGAKTPQNLEAAFYPWKVVHNAKMLQAPEVKYSRTATTVTLKWNKVQGANGYRVYIYNKDSKEYEALATISKTSYKVAGLNANTSYKFAVRAYAKTVSGNEWADDYEKLTVRTLPQTPTLYVSSDDGDVIFNLSKVQGATGYVVYWSDSKNGQYKKLAAIKTTSAESSKFDTGKTYYFKVRAYTKTSGGNIYSAYSSVKSVTVK